MDMLNDEQLILCFKFYHKSVCDHDCLGLNHLTFQHCTLPVSLQLIIALWFYATGSYQSVIGEVFYVSLKCHTSGANLRCFVHLAPNIQEVFTGSRNIQRSLPLQNDDCGDLHQ